VNFTSNFTMIVFTAEVVLKVISEGHEPLHFFTGTRQQWHPLYRAPPLLYPSSSAPAFAAQALSCHGTESHSITFWTL